jgi:hypothetical protein
MKNKDTVTIELTRKEVDVLAEYHDGCEKRSVEMREYLMAQESKERGRLFHGLKQTGWYMGIKNYETTD